MATYTCTLNLNPTKTAVATSWSSNTPDPKVFSPGDEVVFTSPVGDWRVEFIDSPFDSTTVPKTLSAPVNEARGSVLVRGRENPTFPFDCIIVVDGETIGWNGGGDDIRVKPGGGG
jgi:hypothetical protein